MKEFDTGATFLSLAVVYAFFAQIIASIYIGLALLLSKVNVPVLVCQALGIRCQALALQIVDAFRIQSDSCGRLDYVKPSASEANSVVSDVPMPMCLMPLEIEDPVATEDPCRQSCELSSEAAVPVPSSSPSSELGTCATDLNLVETVTGLQGLKVALASHFVSDILPDSFRLGYVVDLNQHWISVHVSFDRSHGGSSLSLIVFDTLEVNYQRYHNVGLLRSSSAKLSCKPRNFSIEDDSVDVVTLCAMRGVEYDIAFLSPICDMRRLTWEEEEQIRIEKKASASKSTIYYDQRGNPFRKIIVQPILQATQDGTCKSRALAVLAWLLTLDDKELAWYVLSNRELFEAELQRRGCVKKTCGHTELALEGDVGEDDPIFGSLMATGKRDKFGRDVHIKVCHLDTLQYNKDVQEIRSTSVLGRCRANSAEALLPSDSRESSLRHTREEEVKRIRQVLLHNPEGGQDVPTSRPLQQWRGIQDHEARWAFLEETCFFGHNLSFKKIPKKYARDEILPKAEALASSEDNHHGFGGTEYMRKYRVASNGENYITHEADPVFHEPLENFFGFLCGNEAEEDSKMITVPFHVLPFPGDFMALNLNSSDNSANLALDLEGDLDERKRQRVSDFSLPSGNSFLNDPISYNKMIANVSLPVKLAVC